MARETLTSYEVPVLDVLGAKVWDDQERIRQESEIPLPFETGRSLEYHEEMQDTIDSLRADMSSESNRFKLDSFQRSMIFKIFFAPATDFLDNPTIEARYFSLLSIIPLYTVTDYADSQRLSHSLFTYFDSGRLKNPEVW